MNIRSSSLTPLTNAWLLLATLTLASPVLGKWTGATFWLPIAMAFIIWAKCYIVADRFLETKEAHPFIRRVVHTFIALPPIALILVTISS